MRFGLSLLTVALVSCATTKPVLPTIPTAAPAALPAAELLTLDGRPMRLSAALGARPALVSLWATWCEACAGEFDALERLSARASSLGAVVVAVAVGEPRSQVAEFVAARKLAYPQLVDEQFSFADALGQKRVPATLVVDRSGRVVFVGGALDEAALAALEKLLAAPVAAASPVR